MNIGEFAKKTGLSKDTIRFYEKQGLIKSEIGENGYHRYSADLIQEVELLQLGKTLGFSLKEIKELKNKMYNGRIPAPVIRKFMTDKLQEVEIKIQQLNKVKAMISARLLRCDQSVSGQRALST